MRGRGCGSSVIPWVSGRRHRWGRSLRRWRRRPSSRHDVREFTADQGASRQPGRSWMHRSRRVGGGARRRVPQRFRWIGRQARGLLADSYCQHPTPNVQWTTPHAAYIPNGRQPPRDIARHVYLGTVGVRGRRWQIRMERIAGHDRVHRLLFIGRNDLAERRRPIIANRAIGRHVRRIRRRLVRRRRLPSTMRRHPLRTPCRQASHEPALRRRRIRERPDQRARRLPKWRCGRIRRHRSL